MANCIAIASGYDKTGREKTVHRLGGKCAVAEANTFTIFSQTTIWADNSGVFMLKDSTGKILHECCWNIQGVVSAFEP